MSLCMCCLLTTRKRYNLRLLNKNENSPNKVIQKQKPAVLRCTHSTVSTLRTYQAKSQESHVHIIIYSFPLLNII